jgi:predicted AAA+ superfamily ATPase
MRIPLGDLGKLVIDAAKATLEQPAFIFLDELTYADEWDLWLKTLYDERGLIQVSGLSSSATALRERRMESKMGRMWDEQYDSEE